MKLSEQAPSRPSTPGILQVRRFQRDGGAIADMIYDELRGVPDRAVLVDPLDTHSPAKDEHAVAEDLLVGVARREKSSTSRRRWRPFASTPGANSRCFTPAFSVQDHPHQYPVGLEEGLYELKTELILRARGA